MRKQAWRIEHIPQAAAQGRGRWRSGAAGPLAVALVAASAWLVGCSPESKVPEGDPAENIRSLALAYNQAAAANRGVGPADEAALVKFLMERNGISEEEARRMLVSPRDNQPYVIRWGLRPSGNMLDDNPPPPPIIVYEQTGADGTRYVADGQMSILALTPEEFAEVESRIE